MKKTAFIMAIALGVSLLAGCGGSSAPSTAQTPAEVGNTGPQTEVVGGWEILDAADVLNEDEAAVFEKACDGWTGSGLEPVAVMATQAVAGVNYCYLTKMTSVTVSPKSRYVFVYVYADLEGNARISGLKDIEIDVDDTGNAGESTKDLLGGWTVADLEDITVENGEVLEKALEGFVGSKIAPIACLARQIVSGTNYCFLVKQTAVTADPVPYIAMAYVYEDLEGNAEIINLHTVNFMP